MDIAVLKCSLTEEFLNCCELASSLIRFIHDYIRNETWSLLSVFSKEEKFNYRNYIFCFPFIVLFLLFFFFFFFVILSVLE